MIIWLTLACNFSVYLSYSNVIMQRSKVYYNGSLFYPLKIKSHMLFNTTNTECSPGSYGANCLQKCGQCRGNSTCNMFDGSCPDGCSAGYIGSLCSESKYIFYDSISKFWWLIFFFQFWYGGNVSFYSPNIFNIAYAIDKCNFSTYFSYWFHGNIAIKYD